MAPDQFNEISSDPDRHSRLIQSFVRRVGSASDLAPEAAMSALVTELTRRRRTTADEQLQYYLRRRKIISVRVLESLDSHGMLEPIGSMYAHGFNISIAKGTRRNRLRFTLAHEICHTFFYEYVPEVKFAPHDVDLEEERLCDFGASELLIPVASIKQTAARLTVCMESLIRLAADFSVSMTSMFIRLRTLRLWSCVLSEWHRMVNGGFVLADLYGGRRLPWQWDNPAVLEHAWHSRNPIRGNAFIHFDGDDGRRYYYPAQFELQRLGNRLLSLWGPSIRQPMSDSPLFRSLSP